MFAENLLESGVNGPRRTGWTTLASFTLQAALLSLLAVVPMLYPEALSLMRPPSVTVPLFSHAPIPPNNNPAHPAASSNTVPFVSSHGVTYGQHTRDVPQGTDVAPPREVVIGDGFSIGDITSTNPPTVRLETPSTKPIVISTPDPASLVRRVQPIYPHLAIISHTEGTVVLHAVISKEGNIESLQLVSGHPLLAPAALDAVRQWRYRPYILNGQIVEVETQITVNFRIGNN